MADRYIIATFLLLAGIAVGAFIAGGSRDGGELPVEGDGSSMSLGERVAALEKQFADEQAARTLVEERLREILEQLNGIEDPAFGAVVENGEASSAAGAQAASSATSRVGRRDIAGAMERRRQQRLNRLLENGYPESEAVELLRLESVVSLEAMRAAWEAQRDGDIARMVSNRNNAQTLLRERIGDVEYERFLTAQGQRTTVQIANVLEGSPGSLAGLRPGDQIVSYNGERTFSISDIRNLTLQGEPGTESVIEIERDGVRMQLNVPTGPIGVNGQGAENVSMSWWGG